MLEQYLLPKVKQLTTESLITETLTNEKVKYAIQQD